MLVSAITSNMASNISHYNRIGDFRNKSLNAQTPYFSHKDITDDDSPIVYDSINQWKKFCENNVLGEKLNIIA